MKRINCFIGGLLGCLLLLALLPGPVSADGGAPNLAYVAGTRQGVSIIDIVQQRISGYFTLGGAPQTLYLSNDGRFLYVTQPALNQVSMVATRTGQVLCTAHVPGSPSFIAFDADTHSLFVAGSGAAVISNLDQSNCHVLHTITLDSAVYGLAIAMMTNGANQLWATTIHGIMIFDAETERSIASVPIPGNPRFLSLPTGMWGYVTTQQGYLYGVALNSHRILPLLSGGQFGTMDFDETTGEVYVPDEKHQQLDVLTPPDPASAVAPPEPQRVYPMPGTPRSIAITSDGQFGFAALNAGQVVMLDIAGHRIINTFAVGGDPRFIITGLYPPVLGTTPQQTAAVNSIGTSVTYLFVVVVILIPFCFIWWQSRKRRASRSPRG